MAHIVAIEQIAPHAALMQEFVDDVGNRAFAATTQACEPHHATTMAVELFAILARDALFVPNNNRFFLCHGSFEVLK